MISVIIATLNDERRLAGTMGALIPATIEGLVRQVIIADAGSTDATLDVAEDAGALVAAGGFSDAVALSREPWLLALDAGARLAPGWERSAHAHMAAAAARAGRIAQAPAGGLLGLLRPAPIIGLLAPRATVQGREGGLADLARALRPVRLDIRAGCEP